MKSGVPDRYIPVKRALKKAGYKVEEVVNTKKKTVITVSPYQDYDPNPVFEKKEGRKR